MTPDEAMAALDDVTYRSSIDWRERYLPEHVSAVLVPVLIRVAANERARIVALLHDERRRYLQLARWSDMYHRPLYRTVATALKRLEKEIGDG